MTEKLKRLVATAKRKASGCYSDFLIISMGEAYSGFWGANGFNNMLVLAGNFLEDEWVILSRMQCDSINILGKSYLSVVDVPEKYDCIRLHFENPIEVISSESTILTKGAEFL